MNAVLTENLSGDVLSSCLFVVPKNRDNKVSLAYSPRAKGRGYAHDTGGSGEDDETEGSGGEKHVDPRFDLGDLDVESRGDDTTLVDSTVELDDNLAGSVVVDDLESINVAFIVSHVSFRATKNEARRN